MILPSGWMQLLAYGLIGFLISAVTGACDFQLIGVGGCRGTDWDQGAWPISAGELLPEQCCLACRQKPGCTGFHSAKLAKGKTSGSSTCYLFGHSDLQLAAGLGGHCYRLMGLGGGVEPTEEQCQKYITAQACQQADETEKSIGKKGAGHDGDDQTEALNVEAERKKGKEQKKEAQRKEKEEEEEEKKKKKEDEQKKKAEEEQRKKKEKAEAEEQKQKEEQKKKAEEEKKKVEEEQKKKKEKEEEQSKKKKNKEKEREEETQKQKEEEEKKKKKKTAEEAEQKKKAEQLEQKKKAEEEVKKEEAGAKKKSDAAREGGKATVQTKVVEDAVEPASQGVDPSDGMGYNGQFLHKVGNGGCRGPQWNSRGCPKCVDRQTRSGCAWSCRNSTFCTAFHILKHDPHDDSYECLLFGHEDVIAVKGLGGECFTFKSQPPKQLTAGSSGRAAKKPVGLIRPVKIGDGRCRGSKWTFDDWPKALGLKTLDQCAQECVAHGCTAFDISGQEGNRFDCNLYGHEAVSPASGVPGVCYSVSDQLTTDDHFVETFVESDAQPTDFDDEAIKKMTENANYHHLGKGACRGGQWNEGVWPILRGSRTVQQCANACQIRQGCTCFDVASVQLGQDTSGQCQLYGHKHPSPASALAANCYTLDRTEGGDQEQGQAPAQEQQHGEAEKPVDDGSLDKVPKQGDGFVLIGDGLCRGPNWQDGETWPIDRGVRSLTGCVDECRMHPSCVAFDVSPSGKGGKFKCHLFGHEKVRPASSIRGKCFQMVGRDVGRGEVAAPKADKKYRKLGAGACRGASWNVGDWPKDKGRRSVKECLAACATTHQCTAFDTSNPSKSGEKAQCYLYGHSNVQPAAGVKGTCYVMSSVPAAAAPKTSAGIVFASDEVACLGDGLCRGPKWQSNDWPVDKGFRTVKECKAACQQTPGCSAFDTSNPNESRKRVQCFLYGHEDVSPASSLKGHCYKMLTSHQAASAAPTTKGPKKMKSDQVASLQLSERGACRGPGWQSEDWPKDVGMKSRRACEETCLDTLGCTAFEVRAPSHDAADRSKWICTLFGHKDVAAASGVPGECYTVTPGARHHAPKAKTEKAPQFKESQVVDEDYKVTDEGWLYEAAPKEVRSRQHISAILHLNQKPTPQQENLENAILKSLKNIYEDSIKPLENAFKYREMSHRHFGDPEILNKPLIVLMGPWSGGKSTMINYLLGTEFTTNAFRAAAEPSPGFNFNIAMFGDREEEISGTEFAAEWTFSSLQKFGEEFLRKLRGKKFPNPLLKKATFAEIPGVLETGTVRKVDRGYPFNDACQWFIDHADLILLVYDYTKLDIGTETEALLDQLKGRESQVRIILNKADEITAQELLKIQNNLIWNVSPLMSSIEPPLIYAGSFWSHPYQAGAIKELLKVQEVSLLRDINEAIEKRVENRISTARRFAVRVRNHAKMVDMYLATLESQKGLLGDIKTVEKDIIEHPERFHIYEGMDKMTNISRYDLPDPKSYKIFFERHPLQNFQTLQSSCTVFKGCPINILDQAIAYDLPELLISYKRKLAPKPKL